MRVASLLALVFACSDVLPPPAQGPCDEDAQCVLAVDLTQCCVYPKAVLASSLDDRDDYVLWVDGQDYSDQLPEECTLVSCAPAAERPVGAVCDPVDAACALVTEPAR